MPQFVSNISKQALQFTSVLVGIYANVDSYSTELVLKGLFEKAKSIVSKTGA